MWACCFPRARLVIVVWVSTRCRLVGIVLHYLAWYPLAREPCRELYLRPSIDTRCPHQTIHRPRHTQLIESTLSTLRLRDHSLQARRHLRQRSRCHHPRARAYNVVALGRLRPGAVRTMSVYRGPHGSNKARQSIAEVGIELPIVKGRTLQRRSNSVGSKVPERFQTQLRASYTTYIR